MCRAAHGIGPVRLTAADGVRPWFLTGWRASHWQVESCDMLACVWLGVKGSPKSSSSGVVSDSAPPARQKNQVGQEVVSHRLAEAQQSRDGLETVSAGVLIRRR